MQRQLVLPQLPITTNAATVHIRGRISQETPERVCGFRHLQLKHCYCYYYCFPLFIEDWEDVNVVHNVIPRVLTLSWLSISWYTLTLAPGSMKSPNRTGRVGMTSLKVVPNSSIFVVIRLSNQVRSSSLTKRSRKTRQLSWYHNLSRCSLFW